MKKALLVLGTLVFSGAAAAQSYGPGDNGPAQGKVNPPSDAANDPPGSSGGWARKFNSQGQMREQDYIDELARQMADAQKQVGQSLTDKDRDRIRSAISRDFIAWKTQYDPRRRDYSEMREKWLVDENALSPGGWAKQRVEWLRAQWNWIAAKHGG